MYYLNARYYNPENYSFITQDSYRGEQKEYNTWNLYAYCGENPINYVDPSGHDATLVIPLYQYGTANVWNPSGWIALAIASGITIGTLIEIGGKLYEVYKVREDSATQVSVKVKKKPSSKSRVSYMNGYYVRTKGNENLRDTGLIGVDAEEIKRRLKNPNISKREKQRLVTAEKALKLRNQQKNRNNAKSKKKGGKKGGKKNK